MQPSLRPTQKQLKTLLPSMSQSTLSTLTRHLQTVFAQQFIYITKQLSYKCHQACLQFRGKKSTGYGRTEQDAHLNAVKNIMEMLIEEEDVVFVLRHQMKGNVGLNIGLSINNYVTQKEGNKENQPRASFVTKPSINLSTASTNSQLDNKKSKSLIKPIHIESLNISMLKTNSNISTTNNTTSELQEQLRSAKLYILELEEKIRVIEEQNKTLKSKNILNNLTNQPFTHFTGTSSVNLQLSQSHHNPEPRFSLNGGKQARPPSYVRNQKMNYSVQQIVQSTTETTTEMRKSDMKQKIPKLKLSMLPNYHGKSNKSMNQSLVGKDK